LKFNVQVFKSKNFQKILFLAKIIFLEAESEMHLKCIVLTLTVPNKKGAQNGAPAKRCVWIKI